MIQTDGGDVETRKHAAQKMMKLLQVLEAEAHVDRQLRIF
jgi:hypothetical protein